MSNLEQGLIHLYVGNGKGKTTSAVGLTVRAVGRGKKVIFMQFLKGRGSGELISFEKLGIKSVKADDLKKFTFQLNEEELEQLKSQHNKALDSIIETVKAEDTDLLVLDEAVDSINLNLLSRTKLVDFLKNKPAKLEIVLTGRDPDAEIYTLADYYTNFECRSHPYERGISARDGIEF